MKTIECGRCHKRVPHTGCKLRMWIGFRSLVCPKCADTMAPGRRIQKRAAKA